MRATAVKILKSMLSALIVLLLAGTVLLCSCMITLLIVSQNTEYELRVPALSDLLEYLPEDWEAEEKLEELLEYLPEDREVREKLTELLEYLPEDWAIRKQLTELLDRTPLRELIRSAYESADSTAGSLVPGIPVDETFYPYYAMLDDQAKAAYSMICAAVSGQKETVRFQNLLLNEEQFRSAWEAVGNDHPEFFWLAGECSYARDINGRIVDAELSYYTFPEGQEAALERFNSAADAILEQVSALASNYEKELFIHNTLAERIVYDLNGSYNQSAYSALVGGASVCAGYAKAFQYLMIRSGIPCYYCTGDGDGDHAWNIVMLGGEYYNVDLTWDDASGSYSYFNRTDADFSASHTRSGMALLLPACSGETYRNPDPMPDATVPDYSGSRQGGFFERMPRPFPGGNRHGR